MRVPHHPALHAGELVAFLGRRAIGGVEELHDGAYRPGRDRAPAWERSTARPVGALRTGPPRPRPPRPGRARDPRPARPADLGGRRHHPRSTPGGGLAAALARREPVTADLPGIGPWTLAYIALRSGEDDAFLPTDLGVRHGLARLGADPARAAALAEPWRPLRGFATAHLWAAAG